MKYIKSLNNFLNEDLYTGDKKPDQYSFDIKSEDELYELITNIWQEKPELSKYSFESIRPLRDYITDQWLDDYVKTNIDVYNLIDEIINDNRLLLYIQQ